MPTLIQLLSSSRRIAHRCAVESTYLADVKHAAQVQVTRCRNTIRSVLVALWVGTIPGLAHAGIWNGSLCKVYQSVLDDELTMIISLAAAAGAIIMWLLDDGHSKIKQNILKVAAGTLTILNLPILWSQVFNHGAACTA